MRAAAPSNSNNSSNNKHGAIMHSTGPASPPLGYNKNRRDISRWLLAFTAVTLLGGQLVWSIIFSIASIICLKEGTLFSVKNIKWISLSIVSFVASVSSYIMLNGSEKVDDEKAYTLKIMLWMGARSIQAFWGITLGMFLLSAATVDTTIEKK